MATYVLKFLKYSNPENIVPDWFQLLNRDGILGFIDKLQRAKVGPEETISVLDCLDTALSFIRVLVLRDDFKGFTTKGKNSSSLIIVPLHIIICILNISVQVHQGFNNKRKSPGGQAFERRGERKGNTADHNYFCVCEHSLWYSYRSD